MKLITNLKLLYRKIFPSFDYYLKKDLSGCQSILDLGCGPNSIIRYANAPYKVGVELFDEYIAESKRKNLHNEYIKEDITKVDFKPKSFDAVMMIDVLEHLSKEDANNLFKKMETWAKKKIIILTPNGYIHQDSYDHNPLQAHRSGWNAEEFKKQGFKVFGINGLKHLRGELAYLKYKPVMAWIFISDVTQKIVHTYPKWAFHLYAVKEIK